MKEFKPQMKYFLTCDQLPNINSDDELCKLFRIIHFGSKFTDNPTKPSEFIIDNTLKQKIDQWAPTLISYLIHLYNTEYKTSNYLTDPEEVMFSTNQYSLSEAYKMENDFYTEFITDKIIITNNSNDTIGRDNLWEEFKDWYKKNYECKNIPKKMDFIKYMSKKLGDPIKGKGFSNITFIIEKESNLF